MSKRLIFKILFVFVSSLVGLVFIFSGYTKLFPVEIFEYSLVDTGFFSWTLAPILARLLIGLEFFIGIALLFNLNSRNMYRLVFGLLVFFCIYLGYDLVKNGNSGNCGCFGLAFIMSPLQAILKNVFLIALVLLLMRYYPTGFTFRFKRFLIVGFALMTFALPFILNPVALSQSEHYSQAASGYELPLKILYNSPPNPVPDVNLHKGKWIVAYLSLACPHCKVAAYKIHILKKKHPDWPFFLVLNGNPESLEPFFSETQAEDIEHIRFSGPGKFLKMSGPLLPAIFLIDHSIVKAKPSYLHLNETSLEKWLSDTETLVP